MLGEGGKSGMKKKGENFRRPLVASGAREAGTTVTQLPRRRRAARSEVRNDRF